jgi:hypothetical protein
MKRRGLRGVLHRLNQGPKRVWTIFNEGLVVVLVELAERDVVLEERAESETGTTGVAGAAATGRGRESQGGNSRKRRFGKIGALLVELVRVI